MRAQITDDHAVKIHGIKYDIKKAKQFLQMLEDLNRENLTDEEKLGIAFFLLRIYVLALTGVTLSVYAIIAILLFTDYNKYYDLTLIVP